ncbi:LysR family transcriptional regulator [Roseburia hominis]
MDIQKFDALLIAIDSGTMTQAASSMGYTQSAISHAIRTLEDEFNVRILSRGRSGVELTHEGQILLPYIRNITNSFREFENKVAEINHLHCGTVRIGTFTSVAVNWLPRILSSFHELYPAITFEIKHGNYAEIADWIAQGIIDCGFTITPSSAGLKNKLLFEDRLFLIYPPDHPLDKLEIVKPEDLVEYPFILVDEGKDPIIRHFFERQNIKLDIQYRVVDDYATIAMVESNLGISVCPELFFYRLPFKVLHRPIHTDFRRRISISYKDHFTLSPIVKEFIKHVQKWAGENLSPLPCDKE